MTNARPRLEEAGRPWRGRGRETLADASAFIAYDKGCVWSCLREGFQFVASLMGYFLLNTHCLLPTLPPPCIESNTGQTQFLSLQCKQAAGAIGHTGSPWLCFYNVQVCSMQYSGAGAGCASFCRWCESDVDRR